MSYWDSSSGQGTGSGSGQGNGRRGYNSSPGYYTGDSSSTTNTWGSNSSARFGMNSGSSNSFDLGSDLGRNQNQSRSDQGFNQKGFQSNQSYDRRLRSSSDSSTPRSPGGNAYFSGPSTPSVSSGSDSRSSSSSGETRSFRRPTYGPAPDGTFGNPTDIFSNEPRPLGEF